MPNAPFSQYIPESAPRVELTEGLDPGERYDADQDEPAPQDRAPYDEVPPMEEDPQDWGPPEEKPTARRRSKDEPDRLFANDALVVRVDQTLRQILASMTGRPGNELLALVTQVRASVAAVELLPDKIQRAVRGLFEALEFTFTGNPVLVDFAKIPILVNRNIVVQEYASGLAARFDSGDVLEDPSTHWAAVVEAVARAKSRFGALALVAAIDDKADPSEVMEVFRGLPVPTAKRMLEIVSPGRTATEWEVIIERRNAQRQLLRLSSGYFSLDFAMSKPDEAPGYAMQGEFHLRASGSGMGKSADSYKLIAGMLTDLVLGYKKRYAKGILCHTEEEVDTKMKAIGLMRGQRFHHLSDNMVLAPIGSSRVNLAMTVYREVANAFYSSQEHGLPITEFLPYFLVLDYIQGVKESGEGDADSTARTSEFCFRGVAAWNIEEMEKASGLSFQAYTGMEWPSGMEAHRVAVVAYCQLRKQENNFFIAGSKNTPLENFVVMDEDRPAWDVRSGDLRIPTRDEIFGSSKMIMDATSVVFLHRSRVKDNPITIGLDGLPHPADTRGRFLLDKTRNGSAASYVPMGFDSQRDGFRGHYVDLAGERWLLEGRIQAHESHRNYGDVIVPIRPVASPLAGAVY